jgi:hypothetical protein
MALKEEPSAHLATRIPRPLYRRMKVHCVEQEIPIRDFVMSAIREKLARDRGHGGGRSAEGTG